MKRAVLTLFVLAVLVLTGTGYASADLSPPIGVTETATMIQPDVTDQIAADLVAMAPVWRSLGVETSDLEHLSLLSKIYDLPVTDFGADDYDALVTSIDDYQGAVHDHRMDARGSEGFWQLE